MNALLLFSQLFWRSFVPVFFMKLLQFIKVCALSELMQSSLKVPPPLDFDWAIATAWLLSIYAVLLKICCRVLDHSPDLTQDCWMERVTFEITLACRGVHDYMTQWLQGAHVLQPEIMSIMLDMLVCCVCFSKHGRGQHDSTSVPHKENRSRSGGSSSCEDLNDLERVSPENCYKQAILMDFNI